EAQCIGRLHRLRSPVRRNRRAHHHSNAERTAPPRRRYRSRHGLRGRRSRRSHGTGGGVMATQKAAEEQLRQEGRAFELSVRDDGIAVITIDVPGETQNTLKAEFTGEVTALFGELERDPKLKGVVFASAKPGSFIAGADINMLSRCTTAEEVTELSRAGQRIFNQIEQFRVPVVAAIDGACLGGG